MTAADGLPAAVAAGPGGAEGGHPQPPSAARMDCCEHTAIEYSNCFDCYNTGHTHDIDEPCAPPVDVAAAVLAAVTPPTPKWCGYDAALLWELLLNDSDEERHSRLTGLIGAAAEMAGAQEEASRHADQVEALRIELDELRAPRCACGKPLLHLRASEDSADWACRIPNP